MANYNYYEEAIQYALSRKVVLPADYYSKFTALQRSQSVSIAGLAQLNQIKHVIDAVNDSLVTGKTFKDFQDAVRSGDASIDLPEYRLDNIFRTNLQVAYNRGRWDQQERVALTRPYLMYSAINDSRTRPTHLALNGIILHRDDKFWLTHYCPLGYRCRCTIISLTEAQARKLGISTHVPQIGADNGWGHNVGEDYAGGVKAALEKFTNEFSSQNPLLKPLIEKAHQTILANAEAALLPPVLPLVEVTEQHLKDLPDDLTDTAALKKLLLDKLRATPPVFNANLNGYVEFYRGGIESALKTRSDLVRKLFLALPDILRYAVIDGFPEPQISRPLRNQALRAISSFRLKFV